MSITYAMGTKMEIFVKDLVKTSDLQHLTIKMVRKEYEAVSGQTLTTGGKEELKAVVNTILDSMIGGAGTQEQHKSKHTHQAKTSINAASSISGASSLVTMGTDSPRKESSRRICTKTDRDHEEASQPEMKMNGGKTRSRPLREMASGDDKMMPLSKDKPTPLSKKMLERAEKSEIEMSSDCEDDISKSKSTPMKKLATNYDSESYVSERVPLSKSKDKHSPKKKVRNNKHSETEESILSSEDENMALSKSKFLPRTTPCKAVAVKQRKVNAGSEKGSDELSGRRRSSPRKKTQSHGESDGCRDQGEESSDDVENVPASKRGNRPSPVKLKMKKKKLSESERSNLSSDDDVVATVTSKSQLRLSPRKMKQTAGGARSSPRKAAHTSAINYAESVDCRHQSKESSDDTLEKIAAYRRKPHATPIKQMTKKKLPESEASSSDDESVPSSKSKQPIKKVILKSNDSESEASSSENIVLSNSESEESKWSCETASKNRLRRSPRTPSKASLAAKILRINKHSESEEAISDDENVPVSKSKQPTKKILRKNIHSESEESSGDDEDVPVSRYAKRKPKSLPRKKLRKNYNSESEEQLRTSPRKPSKKSLAENQGKVYDQSEDESDEPFSRKRRRPRTSPKTGTVCYVESNDSTDESVMHVGHVDKFEESSDDAVEQVLASRKPKQSSVQTKVTNKYHSESDALSSDDENVPLSKSKQPTKTILRKNKHSESEVLSNDDEDVPLSKSKQPTKKILSKNNHSESKRVPVSRKATPSSVKMKVTKKYHSESVESSSDDDVPVSRYTKSKPKSSPRKKPRKKYNSESEESKWSSSDAASKNKLRTSPRKPSKKTENRGKINDQSEDESDEPSGRKKRRPRTSTKTGTVRYVESNDSTDESVGHVDKFEESSDDAVEQVVASRKPKQSSIKTKVTNKYHPESDTSSSDDENVPLSKSKQPTKTILRKNKHSESVESSSDDDVPVSRYTKSKPKSSPRKKPRKKYNSESEESKWSSSDAASTTKLRTSPRKPSKKTENRGEINDQSENESDEPSGRKKRRLQTSTKIEVRYVESNDSTDESVGHVDKFEESSDDAVEQVVASRKPKQSSVKTKVTNKYHSESDTSSSDDENVPLSKSKQPTKNILRKNKLSESEKSSSDDENVPLSKSKQPTKKILRKNKLSESEKSSSDDENVPLSKSKQPTKKILRKNKLSESEKSSSDDENVPMSRYTKGKPKALPRKKLRKNKHSEGEEAKLSSDRQDVDMVRSKRRLSPRKMPNKSVVVKQRMLNDESEEERPRAGAASHVKSDDSRDQSEESSDDVEQSESEGSKFSSDADAVDDDEIPLSKSKLTLSLRKQTQNISGKKHVNGKLLKRVQKDKLSKAVSKHCSDDESSSAASTDDEMVVSKADSNRNDHLEKLHRRKQDTRKRKKINTEEAARIILESNSESESLDMASPNTSMRMESDSNPESVNLTASKTAKMLESDSESESLNMIASKTSKRKRLSLVLSDCAASKEAVKKPARKKHRVTRKAASSDSEDQLQVRVSRGTRSGRSADLVSLRTARGKSCPGMPATVGKVVSRDNDVSVGRGLEDKRDSRSCSSGRTGRQTRRDVDIVRKSLFSKSESESGDMNYTRRKLKTFHQRQPNSILNQESFGVKMCSVVLERIGDRIGPKGTLENRYKKSLGTLRTMTPEVNRRNKNVLKETKYAVSNDLNWDDLTSDDLTSCDLTSNDSEDWSMDDEQPLRVSARHLNAKSVTVRLHRLDAVLH